MSVKHLIRTYIFTKRQQFERKTLLKCDEEKTAKHFLFEQVSQSIMQIQQIPLSLMKEKERKRTTSFLVRNKIFSPLFRFLTSPTACYNMHINILKCTAQIGESKYYICQNKKRNPNYRQSLKYTCYNRIMQLLSHTKRHYLGTTND